MKSASSVPDRSCIAFEARNECDQLDWSPGKSIRQELVFGAQRALVRLVCAAVESANSIKGEIGGGAFGFHRRPASVERAG